MTVYILFFGILIVYKHLHNVISRNLFLSIKNFKEQEKLNEVVISNIFIIQKFNSRTCEMTLFGKQLFI